MESNVPQDTSPPPNHNNDGTVQDEEAQPSPSTSVHSFSDSLPPLPPKDVIEPVTVHPDFVYNKHDESIFDDERLFPGLHSDANNEGLVKFDENNPDIINNATLKALLVQLTSPDVIDYNLICDFFLTYRMFVSSEQVMSLLLTRLIWSLQYINSHTESNIRIGKLVLLRTFVVLRHWIINYFIDDFDSNIALCDLFTSTINKITIVSNLVGQDSHSQMVFETKILSDLKIHWLNLINDFWKLGYDLDLIVSQGMLKYELPTSSEIPDIAKKVSQSNNLESTSIHTNPSYRRSAMLSLYDKKAFHKCIIFDENGDAENPQYSINNLLLQHQSSRQSLNIKLQELQNRQKDVKSPIITNYSFQTTPTEPKFKSKQKTPLAPTNRHNHMNIKDSSLALKKTTSNPNHTTIANIENVRQEKELPPVVPPKEPMKKWKLEASGFSTNGNIKLPNSKVLRILPPTPVKKMDYVLKPGPGDLNGSPRKNHPGGIYSPPRHEDESSGMNRKKSIKMFVEGWKKTMSHRHEYGHSRNISGGSSKTIQPAISTILDGAMTSMVEENEEIMGHRVDVLSARIIDELEYLLRYYIKNENSPGTIIEDDLNGQKQEADDEIPNDDLSPANIEEIEYDGDKIDYDQNEEEDDENEFNFSNGVDVMGSPAKKPRIVDSQLAVPMKGELDFVDREDSDDQMDINDLSDLNIVKIDNLINTKDEASKNNYRAQTINPKTSSSRESPELLSDTLINNSQESSFQKPASINWNDEGNLDLENSGGPNDEEDEASGIQDISHSSSVLRHNNPAATAIRLNKQGTSFFDFNPDSPPEPPTAYPNQSSGSLETSISTPSNFTQYDAEIADLGIALSPQSMKQSVQQNFNGHIQHPQFKRISFDSSSNIRRGSAISRNSGGSAFRRDSTKSYVSYDSAFSISNASRSSERHEDRDFSGNAGLKRMNGFNNLRGPALTNSNEMRMLDTPVRIKTGSASSFISRSSSVRRSVRFSTLCALTELPFSNYQTESIIEKKNSIIQRTSKSSDVADSSIFSVAIKSRKNSVKTTINESINTNQPSNNSSTNSVAIPGISSYVLKELAAIPDESFQSNDPIEFALFKLEGKDSTKILNAKRSSESRLKAEENSSTDSPANSAPDSTQDILDEIQNAKTEDLIDITQQDITPEGPLTPVKRKLYHKQFQSDSNPLTSTPNNDSKLFNPSNLNSSSTSPGLAALKSPKIILEKYNLTNDNLSVKMAMNSNTHVSFVLGFDSQSLANHFTIIEKDMLQEVDWKELIELKWNKELTPVNSWLEIIVNDTYYHQNKGVNLIIARFNLMVNWIISEILLTKTQKERIFIISRFIHVAQKCYAIQNFSTLMQIILALTSEKVQKLRETWKNLPAGDILTLKNLEELASPVRNFLNIRLYINQMKPSKGCIPFVGLYLSDLIFNAERPTFIKPKKAKPYGDMPVAADITERRMVSPSSLTNSSRNGDNSDMTTSTIISSPEVEKVVNFSKFRTSVHIVKSLSQCIEWSSHYKLSAVPELLSKCLYIKSLDEEEMNFCLQCLEDS